MKGMTEVMRSYGLENYEFTKLNSIYYRLREGLSPFFSCIWYFYAA